MKLVYASRTGNVESIVQQLQADTFQIQSGNEIVDTPFILFTYTDGYGDIPYEVDTFLSSNASNLKGVIVSGDTGYGEAFCQAGDKISEQYQVPCLYKVENAGTDEDIAAIKQCIQ